MNLPAEQLRALMIVHALDERRWSRMGPLHHREIHKARAEVWVQAARMVRRTFAHNTRCAKDNADVVKWSEK